MITNAWIMKAAIGLAAPIGIELLDREALVGMPAARIASQKASSSAFFEPRRPGRRDLFQNGQITDETKQQVAELQKNVALLDKVAKGLSYKPEDLANGAADLLEEVQSTKITGEEEAFSHYDLGTFAGNVEGAQQAFAFLEPGLVKIDPDLAKRVSSQFASVKALLDTYRDPSVPGGYKLYTDELKASDGAKLSKAVQALQEPLSQIAEKVATAG